MKYLLLIPVILFACAYGCSAAPNSQGSLVIVGGGLRESNEAIYRAFIDRCHGGPIGIVPAASGKPSDAAEKFKAGLQRYGVPSDRIRILPLAIKDDSTTPDLDESSWSTNGADEDLASAIEKLSGIWFTGGDQQRIIDALRRKDGSDTPVLTAIYQVYQNEGVIGGTSAGAAMQSETMILGGSSPAALEHGLSPSYSGMESQESGPLTLGHGLGFFPHGLIDQHFDRKARLGRLIVALTRQDAKEQIGYGIDEDTALVYDASSQQAQVIGSATVSLVDARQAKANGADGLSGIRLSILGEGDSIAWPDLKIAVNPKKSLIKSEYLAIEDADPIGLFSPYGGRLEDALGFLLLDNSKRQKIDTEVQGPSGSRRTVSFLQDEISSGYWGYLDGQRDSYTILGVDVSIEPTR